MDRKKKERVNLRKRLMPSGNTSLYLDVFTKEARKYEYLKLYHLELVFQMHSVFYLW